MTQLFINGNRIHNNGSVDVSGGPETRRRVVSLGGSDIDFVFDTDTSQPYVATFMAAHVPADIIQGPGNNTLSWKRKDGSLFQLEKGTAEVDEVDATVTFTGYEKNR